MDILVCLSSYSSIDTCTYHGVIQCFPPTIIGFTHLLCHVLIALLWCIRSINETINQLSSQPLNLFLLLFSHYFMSFKSSPFSLLAFLVNTSQSFILQIIPHVFISFPMSTHFLVLWFHFSLISWCAEGYFSCLVLTHTSSIKQIISFISIHLRQIAILLLKAGWVKIIITFIHHWMCMYFEFLQHVWVFFAPITFWKILKLKIWSVTSTQQFVYLNIAIIQSPNLLPLKLL